MVKLLCGTTFAVILLSSSVFYIYSVVSNNGAFAIIGVILSVIALTIVHLTNLEFGDKKMSVFECKKCGLSIHVPSGESYTPQLCPRCGIQMTNRKNNDVD